MSEEDLCGCVLFSRICYELLPIDCVPYGGCVYEFFQDFGFEQAELLSLKTRNGITRFIFFNTHHMVLVSLSNTYSVLHKYTNVLHT